MFRLINMSGDELRLDALDAECLCEERHRDDGGQEQSSDYECADRVHVPEESQLEDVFTAAAVEAVPQARQAERCECHGRRRDCSW